jgi:hypothetical protein
VYVPVFIYSITYILNDQVIVAVKLCNFIRQVLCSSFGLKISRIIYWMVKKDEMGRACSMNGEKRNAYRILVGTPEANSPLGRTRRRWWTILK